MKVPRWAGSLALALLTTGAGCASDEPNEGTTRAAERSDVTTTTAEPAYVILEVSRCEGVDDNLLENPLVPGVVDEIMREFGTLGVSGRRYLGFSPCLLPALNLTIPVLRARVVQALDLAERTGLAVFFHLDDMHFWYKRTELIRDPEAVEWSAFPKKGEAYGPIVPRYWLNWGNWVGFPAPPPCFECPKFRTEVARRLTGSVAGPIVERLARWKADGKEYLFAGIAIGNETQVPDLRSTAQGGQELDGIDLSRTPPARIRMRREDMVRAGYASLYRRGYDNEAIERLAKKAGKSGDETTDDLLDQVAHDYAEFGARTLRDAGLPRDRLYTHFTSPFRAFLQRNQHSRPDAVGTAGSRALPPPVSSAVNAYSRPGFTVARDMLNLADLTARIAEARGPSNPDRAWAAVESYATTGQPGVPQTQPQYEVYLGSLFASGASVINVRGWDVPLETPFAVKRAPGALRAIRSWLSGANLPTTLGAASGPSFADDRRAVLRGKIERFHQAVAQWQREGQDLREVGKIMEQFEPNLHAGKIQEAEAVLDRALAFLNAR